MNSYTLYGLSDLFDDLVSGTLYSEKASTPNRTKEVLCKSDKPYDIFTNEKTGAVSFGFGIPKLTKKDIKVSYKDNYFTVSFDEIKKDDNVKFSIQGISTKESKAIFYVDTDKYDISKDKVNIVVKDGYLTITIPVKSDYCVNVDYDIK